MWVIRYFLIVVIVLMILGFAVQNSSEKVTIKLLTKQYDNVLLVWVLFEAFVLGLFFWFVLSIAHFFKLHSIINRQKRENKKLLEEIKTIRNMPFEENEDEQSAE